MYCFQQEICYCSYLCSSVCNVPFFHLIMMCINIILFVCLMLGFRWLFWIYRSVIFNKTGKCLAMIIQTFLLSSFGDSISYISRLKLSHSSLMLCSFFLQSFFFINLFYIFIYFWLHWVFIAACGLSLVVASRGYSLLQCAGFSLWWLLLLQSMGSRHAGFSSCGMWAQ